MLGNGSVRIAYHLSLMFLNQGVQFSKLCNATMVLPAVADDALGLLEMLTVAVVLSQLQSCEHELYCIS